MHLKLIAPLAAALALSACAKTAPVLTADDPRNDGIAKTCTPTNPDMSKPGPHTASIAMTNDGWCGVFATDKSGKPFRYGLLRVRPAHGRVLIQTVANATRVEYTPENNYVGADTFTVALVSATPGVEDVPLAVSVNATQGASVAPPPSTAPAATTKPTTPARRAPARRPAPAR